MANLGLAEKCRPQEGRIKLSRQEKPVDVDVSMLPTKFGESVVIQIHEVP